MTVFETNPGEFPKPTPNQKSIKLDEDGNIVHSVQGELQSTLFQHSGAIDGTFGTSFSLDGIFFRGESDCK